MSAAVDYGRLSPVARQAIRWAYPGGTIAGYIRHRFPDGIWRGDDCGCTDSRCIGYHHGETEHCGCLEACLQQWWLDDLAPVVWHLDLTCGPACDLEWHRGGRATIGPLSGADAPVMQQRWAGLRGGHVAVLREVRRA